MKEIRVFAEAEAKPSGLAKLLRFSYVEGGRFTYRVRILNTGDEPVGENDLARVETVWSFRGEDRTSRVFRFPRQIPPGNEEILDEHRPFRKKTPGHAALGLRLWTLPGAPPPTPNVTDAEGHPVLVPYEGEWHDDPEERQKYFIKTLHPRDDDFKDFWAASQTEVKQTFLMLLSFLALLAGVASFFLRR